MIRWTFAAVLVAVAAAGLYFGGSAVLGEDPPSPLQTRFHELCSRIRDAEEAVKNPGDSVGNPEQRDARLELLREYNTEAQQQDPDLLRSLGLPESLDVADYDTEC